MTHLWVALAEAAATENKARQHFSVSKLWRTGLKTRARENPASKAT